VRRSDHRGEVPRHTSPSSRPLQWIGHDRAGAGAPTPQRRSTSSAATNEVAGLVRLADAARSASCSAGHHDKSETSCTACNASGRVPQWPATNRSRHRRPVSDYLPALSLERRRAGPFFSGSASARPLCSCPWVASLFWEDRRTPTHQRTSSLMPFFYGRARWLPIDRDRTLLFCFRAQSLPVSTRFSVITFCTPLTA